MEVHSLGDGMVGESNTTVFDNFQTTDETILQHRHTNLTLQESSCIQGITH
jgi:hypothetical protein